MACCWALKALGATETESHRATAHPSTEQLLRAFKEITLTVWQTGTTRQAYVTPLTAVQQRILKLLKFPAKLYSRLETDSLKLSPQMGEP